MEEKQTQEQQEEQTAGQQEPQGTDDTDWKAKYEEAVKQSRKWESRAKAGKPSDADKISELESQVQTLTITAARAQVAAEKGVPEALIAGSTREEMEASANALLEWRGKQEQREHETRDRGETGAPKPKKTNADVFGEIIDNILS